MNIPIYISLQYEKNFLKFPVNPETLKKEIPSSSATADIEGIGQVSIPKTPGLATINISSFFWQAKNLVPSSMYINWLEKWQKSKKPANLIVTKLNYSMLVTCEAFNHWVNGGEESDPYFELQLKEYRPYGAKFIGQKTNLSLLEKIQKLQDLATPPVLVEIPRPLRGSSRKVKVSNLYTCVKGDTLLSVAKRLTGATLWKKLYDNNKKEIGDAVRDSTEFAAGTVLKVPDEWKT